MVLAAVSSSDIFRGKTWHGKLFSSLVLLSPGSHWQTPIGVLQNVCNAARVSQADIHGTIAQQVSRKNEDEVNPVASEFKRVAVKIPLAWRSYATRRVRL